MSGEVRLDVFARHLDRVRVCAVVAYLAFGRALDLRGEGDKENGNYSKQHCESAGK